MRRSKSGTFGRGLQLPIALILTAVLASGCGGVGSSGSSAPPPAPTPTPNISVAPTQADFGIVVLDKTADKNIGISNTGTGTLSIGQITAPGNAAFTKVSDLCSNTDLAPSHVCTVTVRFAPTVDDDYTGTLTIPSNDSDSANVAVSVAGKGRALNVTIDRITNTGQTVHVVASVRDKNDNPVNSLAEGNFSLEENGAAVGIAGVSNVVDPGVSVDLVLDYSSTMAQFSTDVETAAKTFVDQLDPATDEAEVIKFATPILVMQGFTSDNTLLKTAIDTPPPFPGDNNVGTALYDALYQAIDDTSARTGPRLAVIAVSDGNDDRSIHTIDEVTVHALDTGVQIFTIGIGGVGNVIVDNVAMQQLAQDTGGQFFYEPTPSDLATVYTTISEILSNEYTIDYVTSSAIGSAISVDVFVTDNSDRGEDSATATLSP